MSWDAYIDNLIARSKDSNGDTHVSSACIIGLDGGAKWTSDEHPNSLKLTPHECANIARAFKSKDFTYFQTEGVHICGSYFTFLKEDEGKIAYANLKSTGFVTMQASKTAVVVALCPPGKQPGNSNKAVATIAGYLESMNM